ncbi:hypothetical protein AVEN_240770-1 [Araneus ventricosus]|uniref:Uncharacterized protein n=1 Tax=Araneus ventricosus TaxID=182803 RepID=A0A4Y2N8A4_ARAVE|nr:hypothetical protein AVEN_240770-1 [Araneus ventricosus]
MTRTEPQVAPPLQTCHTGGRTFDHDVQFNVQQAPYFTFKPTGEFFSRLSRILTPYGTFCVQLRLSRSRLRVETGVKFLPLKSHIEIHPSTWLHFSAIPFPRLLLPQHACTTLYNIA